jgi:peptidoglycan hydrolase CwlO-like protein
VARMKKILGLVSGLALLLLFSVSCGSGITQEQYDQVNADLTSAQAQVQTLQADLNARTEELADKNDKLDESTQKWQESTEDLAAAQAQISALEVQVTDKTDELAAKTDEINNMQENTELVKTEYEILYILFMPALTGEIYDMSPSEQMDLSLDMRDKVDATGDPVLSSKFQALIDGGGSEEAVIDFYAYLMDAILAGLD